MRRKRVVLTHRRPQGAAVCLFLVALTGCTSLGLPAGPQAPRFDALSALYEGIVLQRSSSLDVLRRMKAVQGARDPRSLDQQTIDQADTVVAASGRAHAGTRTWFTLAAFERYGNTAERKAFCYLDERARRAPLGSGRLFMIPRTVWVFDAQGVVGDVPATAGTDRRVAVLRLLSGQLRQDIERLGRDRPEASPGSLVTVNGLLMNQVLRDALNALDRAPVLAEQLDRAAGVPFESLSLGAGRLWLLLDEGRAALRVTVGLPAD